MSTSDVPPTSQQTAHSEYASAPSRTVLLSDIRSRLIYSAIVLRMPTTQQGSKRKKKDIFSNINPFRKGTFYTKNQPYRTNRARKPPWGRRTDNIKVSLAKQLRESMNHDHSRTISCSAKHRRHTPVPPSNQHVFDKEQLNRHTSGSTMPERPDGTTKPIL